MGAQILMGTADLSMKSSAPRSHPRPPCAGEGVGGRSWYVRLALDPAHCPGAAHRSRACGLLVKEPKEVLPGCLPGPGRQQDRHPQAPTLSVWANLRRRHHPHPYWLFVRPMTLLC